MKDKFNEVLGGMSREDMIKSSTSDKAKCQMTYYTPGDSMTMFCHWMAESTDAINEQLSQMNDFFEPHQFTEVKEEVFDFNKQEIKMKKTILTLIISLLTTYSLAETGKFNASGAGSWAMNVMNAGNGNMSITYDCLLYTSPSPRDS